MAVPLRSLSTMSATFVSTDSACSMASSSSSSLVSTSSGRLRAWMYWERLPQCWTKVFVVLDGAFLWLFKQRRRAARCLLVQLAVAKLQPADAAAARLLRVVDATGEDVALWLADEDAELDAWRAALEDASHRTKSFLAKQPRADARALPRESFFRGTLTELRAESRREKCARMLRRLALCCRRRLRASSCAGRLER